MATDRASDIALVNVPEDLPVAPFADDSSLSGGSPDLTLSFVPAGGTSLALHCTPGSVTDAGSAIASGPAGGMPTITSSPSAPAVAGGEPLLDAAGRRGGHALRPRPPAPPPPVTFLPSQLVVGVADDLRSKDRVVHGWLGVSGTDAPGDTGAKVEAGAVGRSGRRPAPGGPGHRRGERPARAHDGRAAGPSLRPAARVPPSRVSIQEASGPKVVDVTLAGSS